MEIVDSTISMIEGFALVEMAISINPTLTIYRNLYENTGSEV